MKRFKIVALLTVVLAIGSAFTTSHSASSKMSFSQEYGYAEYNYPYGGCDVGYLDWGDICDKYWFGRICTISNYPAYATQIDCQYQNEFAVLRTYN